MGGTEGGNESCGRKGWWRMRRWWRVEVEDKGRRVKEKRRRRRTAEAVVVYIFSVCKWNCLALAMDEGVCVLRAFTFFHSQ